MPLRGIQSGDANSSIEAARADDAAKSDAVRSDNGMYRRPMMGKLEKADTASFPFLAPQLEAPGARAAATTVNLPRSVLEPLHGQIIASDPADAHVFQNNGELKSYLETIRLRGDRRLTPSRTDTAARARWRSLVKRFASQDKAAEKGIAADSPLARMNRATVTDSAQKTFFRERAREQGFDSIDDAQDDPDVDKNLANEIKKHLANFKEWSRGWTKAERGYFALEMARIKASYESLEQHQNNQELNKLRANAEKTRNAKFGQDSNSLKGHLADYAADSLAYRDRLHQLTDDGIEAGVRELEYFLNPEHDADAHFRNKSERDKIVADFRETCRDYKNAVHLRIESGRAQREALDNTPLPHLGMSVELRGSENANRLLSEGMERAEYDRGWSTPRTFTAWLKGIAKDISALFGLLNPLNSNRLENFFSRFSASYRLRKITEDGLAHQVQDLKRINQKLAEKWVKETYKYEPDEAARKNAKNEPLYDPHGLFAAFANYTRTEIVEAVKDQLKLAAESDLFKTKEKRAKEMGVDLEKAAANAPDGKASLDVPGGDDFIDDSYLLQLAEGIVDGMENALGDALVDQLRVREDSQLTVNANAYVNATDIQVEMMCGRAWGAVDKMLHADLYSPTRKFDCDQFLAGQKEHLGTIQAEITRAKAETIPVGDIDGLSGPLALPAGGDRLKHLDNAMAFARTEFNAAEKAAELVDTMLGTAETEGSMLWLDSELGLDSVGAGLESGDTPEKCEADFQKRTQAIGALKDDIDKNAGKITGEVRDELDDMIWNLEARTKSQRDIRLSIIGLDEKMREAKFPEDLTGLADDFDDNVRDNMLRMELAAGLSDRFQIKEVIDDNKALRRTTLSRLQSTNELLKTHNAAKDATDDAIKKIGNGDLSLEKGLQNIDDVYKLFSEQNDAHQKEWRKYKGIGDKFPNIADEIADKHAQALMAALQIAPEKRNFPAPEKTLPNIELLHKAGVLNDQFAAAHRKDMLLTAIEKGVLSAEDLAESVRRLGVDGDGKAFAPKFASYLYQEEPDKRLQLTLALLRGSGANADEIHQATRDHYRRVANFLLGSNMQGTLLVAFDALKLPLRDVNDQVKGIQKLFENYPDLFNTKDKDKLQTAINNLRILISEPDVSLTETEMTQAVALANRLAEINDHDSFDTAALAKKRVDAEQRRGRKLKDQIAARFGLDGPDGLNDAGKVKSAAHDLINTPSNQDGLQDVMARSAGIRDLIETQQESAALLEGAILKPLKKFAQHLDPGASTADARKLMQSEDFREQAGVLQNLNRLLVADETVLRNRLSGNTDNTIHDANLTVLTKLSRQLRKFNPDTMKADGSTLTNGIAMWWNNESPEDVVQDLRDNNFDEIADRFVNVWKHLVTLNALNESNNLLADELTELSEQREDLLGEVQRHRSNQLAMMAALNEFGRAGGDAKDFKFTKDRVGRIKETLADWGQPGAWDTLSRTYDIDGEESIAGVLDLWSADCNRLPVDIRRKADTLNGALAGFETLIKTLADSNAAMAGTHIASDRLNSLDEQQAVGKVRAAQAERLKYTRANSVLTNLITSPEDWSAHPGWAGGPRREALSDQYLEPFNEAFIATLKEKFPNSERAGSLIQLLDQAADFDRGLRVAKNLPLYTLNPQENTLKPLAEKSKALQNAAKAVKPADDVVHRPGAAKKLEEKDLLDLLSHHIARDVQAYAAREMLWLDPKNVEVISTSSKDASLLSVANNPDIRKGPIGTLKDKIIDAVTSNASATDPLAGDNGLNTDLSAFESGGNA